MEANEIETNEDLMKFLNGFYTAEERGDYMRNLDNDIINRLISLSQSVATKMWLSHYKK